MNLQRITDILKKIFKLPPIPTILISVPSFVLVIYVLANNMENMAISYVAYTLSAYAMVITITGMAEVIRLIRKGIENHPFIFDLCYGTLCLLCSHNVRYQCGKVQKIWKARDVSRKSNQSDSGIGIHAFSGDSHVSTVWRR